MSRLGAAGRLLRIESRRTPAWILLPVLAALTWLASPYGRTLRAPVALWSARSLALPGALQVIGPFAAGIAAWVASRESRQRMTELVTTTSRPGLSRRLGTWAASTAVGLAFYAAATVIIFAVTAGQATWSGPLWWPVAVGAVGIVAFSAVGFALGALLPSRFTAPLVAIGLLFGLQLTLAARFAGYVTALVSPVVDSVNAAAVPYSGADTGIAQVQLIFAFGVLVAALAVLALRDTWRARPAGAFAVVAAVAGLALTAGGLTLARTAVTEPGLATVIPSLRTAPVAATFTPVCDTSGAVPVCTHPAFRSLLPTATADLTAITDQVAGLPAAPRQLTIGRSPAAVAGDTGSPQLGLPNSQGPMSPTQIRYTMRFAAASAIVGMTADPATDKMRYTPPQLAVAEAMMLVAGETINETAGAPTSGRAQVITAAHRFAALPPNTRHDWLATHLASLMAGSVTLEQLP
jgi:hypothetical protein